MQLDLFPTTPRAPAVNRPTSIAAAEEIEGSAETLRAHLLAFIRARGDHGATDDECQQILGMGGNTQRPRRRELERMRLIVDSGTVRKTASNRDAIVWCARKQEAKK